MIVTKESYTSTARFLDGDPVSVYETQRSHPPLFSGKRVKRGLYRSARGRQINADVNGSDNILRKALPDALGTGIAGAAVHRVRLPVRTKRVAYSSSFFDTVRYQARRKQHISVGRAGGEDGVPAWLDLAIQTFGYWMVFAAMASRAWSLSGETTLLAGAAPLARPRTSPSWWSSPPPQAPSSATTRAI